MPPKWRIYYHDNTTVDTGRPPPLGVVCIAQRHSGAGVRVLREFDHYWYDGEDWWGADTFGILDNLAVGIIPVYYCRGITVDREAYDSILKRAFNDPDLEPKSGHLKYGETPGRGRW